MPLPLSQDKYLTLLIAFSYYQISLYKHLILLEVQNHSKFSFLTLKKYKTSSEFLNVLMSHSCAGNLYVGPSKPKYNPLSSKSIAKSCPSKPNAIINDISH